MEKSYQIRVVFRGFEDPNLSTPRDLQVSSQTRPMDLLPNGIGPSGLVFALDGKEITAATTFDKAKIQEGSLLLVIKLRHAPAYPQPVDPHPPVLYGCPSATDVEGLVPESMVQAFQGFEAVEL